MPPLAAIKWYDSYGRARCPQRARGTARGVRSIRKKWFFLSALRVVELEPGAERHDQSQLNDPWF